MIVHSPVISTSWGPTRARFVRGLGQSDVTMQDGKITGTITAPITGDQTGTAGGNGTGLPSGPFSGQGTGSGPTAAFTFSGDLCPQILGQSTLAQAICNSNFSFCRFLCNLAGQQNNLDTCVQTYCPAVFITALIASGLLVFWLIDRVVLARR